MTEALGGPGSSFLDRLGDRADRRAEPRTSISLAGAGCALGILGVLILAGDTGLDDETGDFSQVPGILLSAVVIALGYFVLSAVREGPLATAGTVAAALGIPAFVFFVTFDQDSLPPYDTEAILIVSAAVWLGSFVLGPAKGRPFFLGAGLIAVWFTVLELVENVFEFPFAAGGFFGFGFSEELQATGDVIDPQTGEVITSGSDFGPTGGISSRSFETPDPATIGILSLVLGAAFLLAARWLDRRGRHGVATPLTFAAIPCLAVGVIGLADDLEASGSGLLLALIGLALAWHGASVWRRATSWIGGATMALGLAIFLGDMAGDDATTGAMLFIAGGLAMVFGGHLLASVLHEPDELAITTRVAVPVGPTRQVVASAPAAESDPDALWRPPMPPTVDAIDDTTDDPPAPPPPPPPLG
ncbi:MAG: hypothetical protein ACJ739_06745 [Acidimicrobiales bacterium]